MQRKQLWHPISSDQWSIRCKWLDSFSSFPSQPSFGFLACRSKWSEKKDHSYFLLGLVDSRINMLVLNSSPVGWKIHLNIRLWIIFWLKWVRIPSELNRDFGTRGEDVGDVISMLCWSLMTSIWGSKGTNFLELPLDLIPCDIILIVYVQSPMVWSRLWWATWEDLQRKLLLHRWADPTTMIKGLMSLAAEWTTPTGTSGRSGWAGREPGFAITHLILIRTYEKSPFPPPWKKFIIQI